MNSLLPEAHFYALSHRRGIRWARQAQIDFEQRHSPYLVIFLVSIAVNLQ